MWSIDTTSSPASASSSGSKLVVPQSTVMRPSRPSRRVHAALGCSAHSLRTSGRECGSGLEPAMARIWPAAPPRWRHRRQSRRRSRSARRVAPRRRGARLHVVMSFRVRGIVEQRAQRRGEERRAPPRRRPRARRGRARAARAAPACWASASAARASPRASSRARQMRPHTERSTPRNADGISLKAGKGKAMVSVWSNQTGILIENFSGLWTKGLQDAPDESIS